MKEKKGKNQTNYKTNTKNGKINELYKTNK